MTNPEEVDDIVGKLFFEKYTAVHHIGEGSFGKIYLGKDIKTNDKFAIKFESKKENNDLLKKEAYSMLDLKCVHLPKVYSYGSTNSYNILVMELLGDSLECCLNKSSRKISIKSTCMIGVEMVNILSFIHSKGFLHRDMKPDNFMFGRGSKVNKLYLIDFGLCKKYLDSNKNHLPIQTGKKLVGTARYASINTHKGIEQGRRDDLESIGYILIYLIKGILPWQGLNIKQGEDHYAKICQKKIEVKLTDLCNGLPKQFAAYIDYCRKLKYEETPNYDYLLSLFKSVLEEEYKIVNIAYDYEWLINNGNTNVNSNSGSNLFSNNNNLNDKNNKSKEKVEKEDIPNTSHLLSRIMNKSMHVSKNSLHCSNKSERKTLKSPRNLNEINEENGNKIYELDAISFK